MTKNIYDLIACPDCKKALTYNNQKLYCPTHGEFPVSPNGIPILFPIGSTVVIKEGEKFYSGKDNHFKLKKIVNKYFRKPKLYIGKSLHDKLRYEYIDSSPTESIILNLGSGHETLFKKENLVNFDIFPHENTHVAGDGHYLPFLDNSFDGVWLCAVLEHIKQPFQVMDEVYRILKPGGFVLITVPFLQYMHASPHDYFRYTKYGVRSICEKFTEIKSGASYTKPFGTLIQLIAVLPQEIFRNKFIVKILSVSLCWLLLPLILFDFFLIKNSKEVLTGGICYLGKKIT